MFCLIDRNSASRGCPSRGSGRSFGRWGRAKLHFAAILEADRWTEHHLPCLTPALQEAPSCPPALAVSCTLSRVIVGSSRKELSACAFPFQSDALHRCDKRERETIGRWYRRYFGIGRCDERVHTSVSNQRLAEHESRRAAPDADGPRKSGSQRTLCWREWDSNLYGAFPVKRLFWVVLTVFCSERERPFFVPSPAIRFAERRWTGDGPFFELQCLTAPV